MGKWTGQDLWGLISRCREQGIEVGRRLLSPDTGWCPAWGTEEAQAETRQCFIAAPGIQWWGQGEAGTSAFQSHTRFLRKP